jgi:hypothetical protein
MQRRIDLNDRLLLGGVNTDGAELQLHAPQSSGLGTMVPGTVWTEAGIDGSARLVWRFGDRRAFWVKAASECLDSFIRLADVPPNEIAARVAAFARTWGMLGICRHGKPAQHGERNCSWLAVDPAIWGVCWEPIEAWVRYSRQIRSLLLIAANLQQGEPGAPQDWQAVERGEPVSEECLDGSPRPTDTLNVEIWRAKPAVGGVDAERADLALALQHWIRYGDVSVSTHWWPGAPNPDVWLDYSWLPGVLAVQLLAALQSRKGLYQCAGCGQPFTPPEGSRKPAKNKRKWCPSCGRLAQFRLYQRRRYAQSN